MMSEDESILEVTDLCVAYGKVEAVHHVNIRVGAGRIVTVIGPNGAGKTTLLCSIMGLLPRTRGTIRLLGEELGPIEVEQMVELGVNLVPESRALFGEMSVEDNLRLGAFMRHRQGYRDHGQTMAEVFDIFPRLKERREQHAGTLSGGERQMLALARALMAKPKLLLLDEPSLGLAPLIVREIFRVIADLKKTGVSILLVEQNARAALKISDYAYVLETGEVALEGPSNELIDEPKVVESYLGLGGKH
ncbi:MAG: ABC transporter ATP-binding protein [Burkholderiaceae bacterium]|nr:ABC transporter ATP-binding protein [Burkholderiaceae bacterium]MCF8183403.1 ABC transporter ATP-binding protein [Polynucleobacter sp.]